MDKDQLRYKLHPVEQLLLAQDDILLELETLCIKAETDSEIRLFHHEFKRVLERLKAFADISLNIIEELTKED